MRNVLTSLILTMLTSAAFADHFLDTIHSVSEGKRDQEHLVYLTNGRVFFFNPKHFSPDDFRTGDRIEVKVDEKNRLVAVKSLPKSWASEEAVDVFENISEDATVLPSYSEASTIFNGMNRSYYNKTECTDRAHVWSYEEWKKYKLISRKVFMFFTSTYIRRYNYNWWFHVSPYTLVSENGMITEYVLDRRFINAPQTMKSWSDVFIQSKKSCPISTYAHYRANNYGPEHCFHVKSHMYNRLPLHVENEENTGQSRSQFNKSEVNYSYRAFSRRSR